MKKLGLILLVLFLVASICFVVYRLALYALTQESFGFSHAVIYFFYGGGAIVGIVAVAAVVKAMKSKD